MASIREENLQKRLENYYAAEEAILSSQEYSINGRSLKRADLGRVQEQITELENKLEKLSRKSGISYGVPKG